MDRDVESLLDILASARLAKTYVEGVSHQEFLQDGELQDSVIRHLEIIGSSGADFASIPGKESRNSLGPD